MENLFVLPDKLMVSTLTLVLNMLVEGREIPTTDFIVVKSSLLNREWN